MSLNPPNRSIMMPLPSTSVSGRYELSFPPALIRGVRGDQRLGNGAPELVILMRCHKPVPLHAGITLRRTLSADALLACRLSQHARGAPPGSLKQNDRSQDQRATHILNRIRAFAQDDDREQDGAHRLERTQDRGARRSDEAQSEDEGQYWNRGADHCEAGDQEEPWWRPVNGEPAADRCIRRPHRGG